MRDYIKSIKDEIINHRRAIHANPELSNQEKQTSDYIANELDKLGVIYERQSTNYGIIARFKGEINKTIAFRADFDALSINEETNLSFASKNANCMHACGHDAHAAILLGLAKVLSKFSPKYNVILVFQPAEEDSPNGGAKRILESGVLDGVDMIYGLHVWPEAKAGEIMLRHGALMANSDHFYVDIVGKSSHAAEPHKGIDSLVAAANWVSSVQSFVSRGLNPFDNAVLTIGTFNSGVRYNVVAQNTKIEGTCRTYSDATRTYLEKSLENSLKALDMQFNTTSKLDYKRGYTALINDDYAVDNLIECLKENDIPYEYKKEPSMGAEDFAFYLKKIKGAFFFLGTGYEGCYPLHHPKFSIDENILELGVLTFAKLAFKEF